MLKSPYVVPFILHYGQHHAVRRDLHSAESLSGPVRGLVNTIVLKQMRKPADLEVAEVLRRQR